MIAVRLLWLAVLLVAIPAWVGNCFLNVDKPCRNPVFLWISGQMLLWAGFQVICVPVILLEGRMLIVTVAYCGYILALLAAATVRYFRQSRTLREVREAKPIMWQSPQRQRNPAGCIRRSLIRECIRNWM